MSQTLVDLNLGAHHSVQVHETGPDSNSVILRVESASGRLSYLDIEKSDLAHVVGALSATQVLLNNREA